MADNSTQPTGLHQPGSPRLNLLLSHADWRSETWADQLPLLLDPLGIRSIKVDSGREAEEVIRSTQVHIAVIDLGIPLDHGAAQVPAPKEEAGPRLLQLLRRINPAPPTVVVRKPQPVERERVRGLSTAMREGAFAVVDRPVQIETLLRIMQRILQRHHADLWPSL